MAGRGKAPSGQRQRPRDEKSKALEELLHDPFEVPPLPKTYKVEVYVGGKPVERTRTYLAETREWYEAWQRSPLAAEFAEVHWRALRRLAKLHDQFERTGSAKLADAIRVGEASFGGSPYDARRLGKRLIVPTGEAEAKDGPPAEVVDAAAARRARLRSVPAAS